MWHKTPETKTRNICERNYSTPASWQEDRRLAVDVANIFFYPTLQIVVTNKLTASCQHGEQTEGAQSEGMKR